VVGLVGLQKMSFGGAPGTIEFEIFIPNECSIIINLLNNQKQNEKEKNKIN
jgi:hypothetical protein